MTGGKHHRHVTTAGTHQLETVTVEVTPGRKEALYFPCSPSKAEPSHLHFVGKAGRYSALLVHPEAAGHYHGFYLPPCQDPGWKGTEEVLTAGRASSGDTATLPALSQAPGGEKRR